MTKLYFEDFVPGTERTFGSHTFNAEEIVAFDVDPAATDKLMRNLAHPALTDLRAAALAILPAPDSAIIERIRACRQISP